MKHIILVLGLLASTGFTVGQVYEQIATPSKSSLRQSSHELQVSLNYTGTDEDGNTEEVDGINTDR